MLADIPIVAENPNVDLVADELVKRSLIPAAAGVDALHVAIATLAGVLVDAQLQAYCERTNVAWGLANA
jgi:hypothetical protein